MQVQKLYAGLGIRGLAVMLAFLSVLAGGVASAHPTSFAPASQGAGFIPHSGGPYMFNPCAEAYWQSAKKTMQIFSAPLPVVYEDAYFDYLIYQGYVAALGGAKPTGGLGGAIAVIAAGGGILGVMPALPSACFPTG